MQSALYWYIIYTGPHAKLYSVKILMQHLTSVSVLKEELLCFQRYVCIQGKYTSDHVYTPMQSAILG